MRTPARDIILRAQLALQDPEGDRWTAADLVHYLNDGQLAIATLKPEEVAVTETFTPVAGARQTLPSDALSIIEVRCNTLGRMRALTRVDQQDLESVSRDWQSMPASTEPVHYMHAPREPRAFYLYPPVRPGAEVELVYAQYPADVPAPAGSTAADVQGETFLEHRWAGPLLDYVLYRAWLRDAEYAGNATLAAGYLATFTAALGAQAPAQTAPQPAT